jgi:hypothetical protein
MKRWITLAISAVAALLLLAAPMRAMGGEEGGGGVDAEASCSMGSKWLMVMEPEVGLKFEATIESGVPDQEWNLILSYNKHVLMNVNEVTEDDGGFEVVIVENNAKGDDIATVEATNLVTGEICWGRLRAGL